MDDSALKDSASTNTSVVEDDKLCENKKNTASKNKPFKKKVNTKHATKNTHGKKKVKNYKTTPKPKTTLYDEDLNSVSSQEVLEENAIISIYQNPPVALGEHNGIPLKTHDLRILNGEYCNDYIITFYGMHLINESEHSQDFLLVEIPIVTIYDSQNILRPIFGLRNQNMIFVPINYFHSHWVLIMLINVFDNEKDTKALFLDSLISIYNPLHRRHVSLSNGEETNELEIIFLNRFIKSFLIHSNPNKHENGNVPALEIIESVRQQGADCGFSVLKNMEMGIELHNELIANCDSRHLRRKIKTHYQKEDATLLRKEIVSLISALSDVRFTELQNSISRTSRKQKQINFKKINTKKSPNKKKPNATKKKIPAICNKISGYFKAKEKKESASEKIVFSKIKKLCVKMKFDDLVLKTKLAII